MEDFVRLPLALFRTGVSSEQLIVYAWLVRRCNDSGGRWRVDYKELVAVTGIASIAKISTSIKALELRQLIEAEREHGKPPVVSICAMPKSVLNGYHDGLERAKILRSIKEINREVLGA